MSTPPPSPSLPLLQRRTMRVLVVAQLLGALGLAAGGTAGALLAEHLTGSAAAAGLPLSLLVLGSGVGAVAVTRVMRDHGRRAGLTAAYLAGTAGAALAVVAAGWGSWPLLLAGCLLLGGGNAAVMLARYAAADLASHRGRSISTVVTTASVGAVAGPNLLGPAGPLAEAVGLPAPTGLFLLAVPSFLGAALVLAAFLRPDPLQLAKAAARSSEQPAAAGGSGELAVLLGDRHIRLALLALAIANLAMVGVMAVAPVHLQHHGAGMGMIGLIISAHIAAMYLPAPVTGWLVDTFGARAVVGLGALVLLTAAAAAVPGFGHLGIIGALLLLGVGWNAGLIGGSALLRDAPVSPSLRTRAEGLGELGMGAAAAAGGSGAGLLLAAGGFELLGVVAAAPCLLLLAVLAANGRRQVGSGAGARSSSGNTTHRSVPATPD
ncbi:MAG TPA: MFS transporter [Actinomycetota bacterium]|nr:MFS transporter [Actinomycetota bacterium]